MTTDAASRPPVVPPQMLQDTLTAADAAGTVREAAALLRQQLAPLKVIVVDAMDMRHEPATATSSRWQLWGASSDGHCWQVTTDLSLLAGLYIADKG
jgi:hypothetical protein